MIFLLKSCNKKENQKKKFKVLLADHLCIEKKYQMMKKKEYTYVIVLVDPFKELITKDQPYNQCDWW